MRVLFDTNAVAYWLGGVAQFKSALAGLIRELKKKKSSLYVSTVTVQEMLVYALVIETGDATLEFLHDKFAILPFDERAALAAAKIGAIHPMTRETKPPERNVWHRDIAILGTAFAHGMDRIVTANEKDFAPYGDLVPCELYVLRPIETRRGN